MLQTWHCYPSCNAWIGTSEKSSAANVGVVSFKHFLGWRWAVCVANVVMLGSVSPKLLITTRVFQRGPTSTSQHIGSVWDVWNQAEAPHQRKCARWNESPGQDLTAGFGPLPMALKSWTQRLSWTWDVVGDAIFELKFTKHASCQAVIKLIGRLPGYERSILRQKRWYDYDPHTNLTFLYGKDSGDLFGTFSGIPSGILSGLSSAILSGMYLAYIPAFHQPIWHSRGKWHQRTGEPYYVHDCWIVLAAGF